MTLAFKEIVGIIIRYEGYIDRIIGDEVLAVFGIPRTHEDDPVRAIRAAMDIHSTVAMMTGRFKGSLEKPLAMHSGIATDLVVTGKTDLRTGRHGITGEPVNRASLLTRLAISGESLVGTRTMYSTSGFFFFEKREFKSSQGAADAIEAYRVLNRVKKPDKIRRVYGLRARLIGRNEEMQCLLARLSAVARGRGTCVWLAGGAGTGKSRLIAEFFNAAARRNVRWLQGNAYAYTQNVPYFPLIDLLGRDVDVRDEDSQAVVRQKRVDELKPICGEVQGIFPIIERLFMLSDASAPNISPESWKIKLKQTLVRMIDIQSCNGQTIICFEDLHWADPSMVDLLRTLLNEVNLPVFFLISYRPGHLVFNPGQITNP